MPAYIKLHFRKRLSGKIRQTGANVHDINGMQALFDARIFSANSNKIGRLCADGGYRGKRDEKFIADAGFEGHEKQPKSNLKRKNKTQTTNRIGGWLRFPCLGSLNFES